MKTIITLLFVLFLNPWIQSNGPVVSPKDLMTLTGSRWTGTLTYLDYSSNRKVSIPSTLVVTQDAGSRSSFTFDYQYPDEPHANSVDLVVLANDGRQLDGELVKQRQVAPDGKLVLVTVKSGTDNRRKALIRHTYEIEPTRFSLKKEVRYDGSSQYFERNEYRWQR
ncbi:MAG: hypothetical protein ACOYLN_13745 [Blastocatellia bacterium]|jgi:hypothetical protein